MIALLGYELVEGTVENGQIQEKRRINYGPRSLAAAFKRNQRKSGKLVTAKMKSRKRTAKDYVWQRSVDIRRTAPRPCSTSLMNCTPNA